MPGTAIEATFAAGDPCILDIDTVNSPTGLWFGTVMTVKKHDTYTTITAQITGPLTPGMSAHAPNYGGPGSEEYGKIPFANYSVYPDTYSNRLFIGRLLDAERFHAAIVREKNIRLDELRAIIQVSCRSDATTPEKL